jgi:hypothetical protein
VKFSVRRITTAVVTLSIVLALACLTSARAQEADESSADEAQTPPSVTQVAGSWTGTDTEEDTPGPMSLDLTQDGKKIGGTFSITTQSGSNGTGTVTGTIKGKISKNHLTLNFLPTSGDNHDCTAKGIAKVDGTSMEGTFLVLGNSRHCKGKGTFELSM